MNDVLVAEISGKRPGNVKARPFKLGVMVKDRKAIDDKLNEIMKRYGKADA